MTNLHELGRWPIDRAPLRLVQMLPLELQARLMAIARGVLAGLPADATPALYDLDRVLLAVIERGLESFEKSGGR